MSKFTSHQKHLSAHQIFLEMEQKERERNVLLAMRTYNFKDFIKWAKNYVGEDSIDEEIVEDLRKRHEIENSPLAKTMREET